jgi:exonuclease VII large subunit
MDSVHPGKILDRGYTMVLRGGKVVPSANALTPEDAIVVRFKDGDVPATVTNGETTN